MFGNSALGFGRPAEGVPVSGVYYDRAVSLTPASELGLRAGVGGASIGRFGWADGNGDVLNSRTDASDAQGLIVIQAGDWRRVFWDDITRTWKIRQGMNMTMLAGAPGMWVQLDSPGDWGDAIYTDPVDGRVIPGYAVGLEATRWTLAVPNGPGGLSLITTWNTPT